MSAGECGKGLPLAGSAEGSCVTAGLFLMSPSGYGPGSIADREHVRPHCGQRSRWLGEYAHRLAGELKPAGMSGFVGARSRRMGAVLPFMYQATAWYMKGFVAVRRRLASVLEVVAARARMEEFSMSEAYIIDAVRTAIGKKGGRALCHPSGRSGGGRSHSSARTHRNRPARCRRRHFSGVSMPSGRRRAISARTSWLAAGLPVEVPGVTVDRQCGSSQQAVHFAAQQ